MKALIIKLTELRRRPLLKSAAYGAMTSGVNTMVLLLGNTLYAFLLGAEQYGTLAIVLSFAQLLQLGNLGLGYGATKLCRERPERTTLYLSSGGVVALVPVLMMFVVCHFGGHTIGRFFNSIQGLRAASNDLLIFSAILSSLALLNEFIGGVLNGLGFVERANNGNIISKSGAVVLSGCALILPGFRSYATVAFCSCLAGAAAVLYQLWQVSRVPGVKLSPVLPRWRAAKDLFGASGGVAAGGIASIMIFPFARLSIAKIAGASQVGLYDLLIKFAFALRGVFELSLRPFIREFAPKDFNYLSRWALLQKANRTIRLIAPLFFAALLSAFVLFTFVFRNRLALGEHSGLTLACCLAVSVASTAALINLPSYFWLVANGKNTRILLSHTIFAAIHIGCGVLAVHLASQFACLAFCLAFAVSALSTLIVLRAVNENADSIAQSGVLKAA